MTNVWTWLGVAAATHIGVEWALAVRRGVEARQRKPRTPQTGPLPFVTLLVPAWHECGTVEGCIADLRALDYPHWEGIVIAGGADNTYGVARAAAAGDERLHVIMQAPHGKNAALNAGLALAQGEVIVLIDADSRFDPGWLRTLVGSLHPDLAAVTGDFQPRRQTPVSRAGQMETIAAYHIAGAVTLQGSGGIALWRTVVEPFPVEVRVGVDWDLAVRLAARGLHCGFCPDAMITTERPATLREWWRNEVRWRRAHLAATIRHLSPTPQGLKQALPGFYLYALAWVCLGLSLLALGVGVSSAQRRGGILRAWVLGMVWLGMRRTSVVLQVAVYTGDPRWLRLLGMPPLLLGLTLAAAWLATLQSGTAITNFKGPRPEMSAEGSRCQ